MKLAMLAPITFGLSLTLSANGSPKTLTADPLTNLPLYPATDSRLHLGNAPTRLPDSHMCKSTMQTDFYVVFDSKVAATVAWYAAHLTGFKKTHAYANNRSQDTFYNADGTLLVSITGQPGKPDENTDTHGLVYAQFQPGISEKTILGMNQQKVVCQ
jgi:hypothetical protein